LLPLNFDMLKAHSKTCTMGRDDRTVLFAPVFNGFLVLAFLLEMPANPHKFE